MFVALAVAIVWIVVVVSRRRLVNGASSALQQLAALNANHEPLMRSQRPFRVNFVEPVNSKARFDRFDLDSFMSRCVIEQEHWLESEIGSRWAAVERHVAYSRECEQVASAMLGKSAHERVKGDRFLKTESRLFRRRTVKFPTPAARVRSVVKYTSPKGKNAYSRSLEWDFHQLRAGLRNAQDQRALQTTAQYLRQQERGKMTDRLRMQILCRDGFRCRMCGASGPEGAQLHVDHIVPVSLGGRTLHENLQALCKPCNLGKSNTFVG